MHRLDHAFVPARWVVALVAVALATGCDGEQSTDTAPISVATRTTAAAPSPTPSGDPAQKPPMTERATFRQASAVGHVRFLAGQIGPREATSTSYQRAAAWVEHRLAAVGYDVNRQRLRVPSGVSWGVPVDAGITWNIVAQPPGLDTSMPYRLVGAHLDTVPQAPGAEDNASGVAVLLELARMAADRPPRMPVMFVAFGAEEPRGDGEALHHFGSRAYVGRMSVSDRHGLEAMVSLDRVGVGDIVPVCTGDAGRTVVQAALLRSARQIGVTTQRCDNTTSDHWSFELEGMPAARVGGTSYPAYHSPADRPGVVVPGQLRRVGRLLWAWLRS